MEPTTPNRPTPKEHAVAKAVRDLRVLEILEEAPGSETVEFDPSNPAGLVRTEIYLYYISHEDPSSDRTHLLSFRQIAEKVIPDILEANENIAKGVVSIVAQQMYSKFLSNRNAASETPLTSEELNEKVAIFHKQRMYLVRQKTNLELIESDPDFFKKLAESGRTSQAKLHIWTSEQNRRLYELAKICIWPEGTVPAGKTNWGEVARLLSEEFGILFRREQVSHVIDKRKRIERKRGTSV